MSGRGSSDISQIDSGWRVPEHWSQIRFRYACHVPKGLVDPEDERFAYLPLIAPNHVESGTGRLLALTSADQQGAASGKFLVSSGEIVYSKIRPHLAKACIAETDALCSADMYPVRPRSDLLDPRYLLYWMISTPFTRLMVDESMRVAMPKVNREALGRTLIPVPPKSQQVVIADFLDRETAHIDALIEKKERLIRLLDEKRSALVTQAVTKGLDPNVSMKDSGVEWTGKIPEHWAVAPLGGLYEVQLGKMLDSAKQTGMQSRSYLRNQDVQWDRINTENLPEMDFSPDDRRRFRLQDGDLLVCEGGDVGRTAQWRGGVGECYYQKALHRVRPTRSEAVSRFLYHTIRHLASSGAFLAGSNPNTIPHLTAVQLRRYRIPIPPPAEAQLIANMLDRRWGDTDQLIAAASRSIVLLRERRTALITRAVIGRPGAARYET